MSGLGEVIFNRIQGLIGGLCWDTRSIIEIVPSGFAGQNGGGLEGTGFAIKPPPVEALENGQLVTFRNKTGDYRTILFTEEFTFGTTRVEKIPPNCSVTLRVRDKAPAVVSIGFTVEGQGPGDGPLLGGKGPPGDSD